MKITSKTPRQECTMFIIDTCRVMSTGEYLPGAILFKGRKKMEVMSWKKRSFTSQREANEFVRMQCRKLGLEEALNEDEIARKNPRK